jgi:HAD domain in Swiss Army Knife RNA repair proteins
MTILLDIDGVLVTTPTWKPTEQLSDGFMKFDKTATKNLKALFEETNASIVLTTTHRVNFEVDKWKEIFKMRGLDFVKISKLNDKTQLFELLDRATEIKEWVEKYGQNKNYVIIDDALSINGLSENVKERWVMTKPLLGFDDEALEKAIRVLSINSNPLKA